METYWWLLAYSDRGESTFLEHWDSGLLETHEDANDFMMEPYLTLIWP